MSKVRFVGLDVHQDSIVIAVADWGRGEAQKWGMIPHDWAKLQERLRQFERDGWTLKICYEAGPTGFELYRRMTAAGYDCQVVAPGLVPQQGSGKVKTDRRDAKRLAHFLRSGDLTAVYVPDAASEALRDLERAREGAKRAERTARQQLSKFLLRQGRRWSKADGSTWTQKHRAWIRAQRFEHEAQNRVLRDYLKAVEDLAERVERLTRDLEELVATSALAPLITAFQACRGVQLVTGATVAAEAGDLRRFAKAKHFMSYVGLVSSEHSSGERRRQGRITRAGNGRLRRILVEAAWHSIHPPAMSASLRERNQRVSDRVREIAWKAQTRLHRKFRRLIYEQHKSPQVAVVALARELAGFLWAIGQEEQLLAS
jgi:transposase